VPLSHKRRLFSGSFWAGRSNEPSSIDKLLDKEDIQLEELLNEESLLTVMKCNNEKLIDL